MTICHNLKRIYQIIYIYYYIYIYIYTPKIDKLTFRLLQESGSILNQNFSNYLALSRSVVVTFENLILLISQLKYSSIWVVRFKSNCVPDKIAINSELYFLQELKLSSDIT